MEPKRIHMRDIDRATKIIGRIKELVAQRNALQGESTTELRLDMLDRQNGNTYAIKRGAITTANPFIQNPWVNEIESAERDFYKSLRKLTIEFLDRKIDTMKSALRDIGVETD